MPGGDGEFDGSSEGSLGGDDEDRGGEMDKYMRLLDSQLEQQMVTSSGGGGGNSTLTENNVPNSGEIEKNLLGSIQEEAGGSGPLGNILGGPVERLKHLRDQASKAED